MLNSKTGLLLAVAGLLVGHYVYLHDLVVGGSVIQMGPASWTIAAVALVVALAGLCLVWCGGKDAAP
ncbi:MAG: hypothetical protein ISR50_14235 [Alphaproteobacteria bacterium]|nr:hypothetical protein [Alphaproteobacteria bacterium]